tara:strand:- start:649 stop:936 length:288 start_codon:yes stop_codon:yes gene_type:complete
MNPTTIQEVEEEVKEDFMWSMECAHELIQEMTASDMNMGAAIGGMLTQTLTALMTLAPDNETAMQVLSSCIQNATVNIIDRKAKSQNHRGSVKIH